MLRRALVAAAFAALAAAVAGCGPSNDGNGASGSTSSSPATPQPTGNESLGEAPVLADGRHPVLPTKVDVAGRKVTFDLIVFLTGEAAKEEWAKQHPSEPDGPPNDYLVVNNNPLLRTLPVASDVTVKVVKPDAGSVEPVPTPFADLAAHLDPPGARIFWITVDKGRITLMEEQFVP